MSAAHRRAARAAAACLLWIAASAGPAAAQIELTKSSGEILSGQSASPSSSTTITSLGEIFRSDAPTTASTTVGFNVNANAGSGLAAVEVGTLSYDVTFTLDHAASFDLTFDFVLRGELLRFQDEDACQGSVSLGDISIPSVTRVRDGAPFPIDVVLSGETLQLAGDTSAIDIERHASRTLQFRGEPVETTAYRMTFIVSAIAISQSCQVSARFGAANGSTSGCIACEYPGPDDRAQDTDGLFVTLTVDTSCGNGVLDAGEACDQGVANGSDGACCDSFCRLAPASKVCRPAAGECDQAESCDGVSDRCPDDLAQPQGFPCTPDSAACTADTCDAAGACAHPLRPDTICDDTGCICDDDGLFCNGKVRCGSDGGGLCIVLPPPCGEDDTCDEEHDVCVTPFGTATPALLTPTATGGARTPTPTSTAVPGVCAGDCNGDGSVVVNELVLGVNLALANQSAASCLALDSNRDDRIAINEIIAAVSNALAGCRP